MTKFILQVIGDPERPELYYSGTGSTTDCAKAKRFDDRAEADRFTDLCGGYTDRGWKVTVVEVQS